MVCLGLTPGSFLPGAFVPIHTPSKMGCLMLAAENAYSLLGSDDYVIDCKGAWLRPHSQDGATILQIGGEIDAYNTDELGEHAYRYAAAAAALVVDMTAVDFLAVNGLRTMMALADTCHQHGVEWALIASASVRLVLRVGGADSALPMSDSVSAALQRLTLACVGYCSGG
jgi:anti-anti-sigma factor